MVYNCIYRFSNQGEICFGKYEDTSGMILGIPSDIFNMTAYMEFNRLIPSRDVGDCVNLATAELHMLCDRDIILGIEFHPECVPLIKRNGVINALTSNGMEFGAQLIEVDCNKNLQEVGYRPTWVRQLIVGTKPYRLLYSPEYNSFITNDGLLKPDFDVTSLSGISNQYFGYKELIANRNYYAVVYVNDKPKFLWKDGDTLKMIGG